MDRELLQAALLGLERRREVLDARIAEVRGMLGGRDVSGPDGGAGRKRAVSAQARARMAEAQRKRWAAAKRTASQGAAKKAAPAKKTAAKRTISEAGRQRIIAALKKRWAAVRAQKKAAAK